MKNIPVMLSLDKLKKKIMKCKSRCHTWGIWSARFINSQNIFIECETTQRANDALAQLEIDFRSCTGTQAVKENIL